MSGKVRLYGETSGYVELSPPSVAGDTVLELPTDSIKPGLVLVAAQSFSEVSAVRFNNCFTSTYQNYRILYDLYCSVDAYIAIRLRVSGADSITTNYTGNGFYVVGTAVSGYYSSGAENRWRVANCDPVNFGINGSADIGNPAISAHTSFTSFSYGAVTGVTVASPFLSGMANNLSTAFDGFSMYGESGTITGNVQVYGYRNSL